MPERFQIARQLAWFYTSLTLELNKAAVSQPRCSYHTQVNLSNDALRLAQEYSEECRRLHPQRAE